MTQISSIELRRKLHENVFFNEWIKVTKRENNFDTWCMNLKSNKKSFKKKLG